MSHRNKETVHLSDTDDDEGREHPAWFPAEVFPSSLYDRHRLEDPHAADHSIGSTLVYNNSAEEEEENTVAGIFYRANECLRPSQFFRYVIQFYAERKMFVFFMIHLIATLAVWFHFFMIKFDQQKSSVPDGAPSYWWKRIVPPLEFGSMHAILLQMALLPLTMSRYTIATLSDTPLNRFIPFNRTLRMHIHLGYTMVIVVFLATCFFFLFFGLLCSRGEQAFCEKFKSEIMCTGYGILASLLIVAGTSYFRHSIPYEIFYAIHHLVFIMYLVTVAHTLDIMQRRNHQQRSQTFKWFSATLLWYICDRAAMSINHSYRVGLLSSSSITTSDGRRMIHIKVQRPTLFQFRPGQYAYLKSKKIDAQWHPFSIASDPCSSYLEFYVEVFDNRSWTGQLWELVQVNGAMELEIMGPIGTGLANTKNFSHVLSIGTGTGIVPLLSLFKQHVNQLANLVPKSHLRNLKLCRDSVHEIELAEENQKGSLASILFACFSGNRTMYVPMRDQTKSDVVRDIIRKNIFETATSSGSKSTKSLDKIREMKKAAFSATRSIYGVVVLSGLPTFGFTLILLTISWNTMNAELFDGLISALQAATAIFQICFAAVTFFWSDIFSFWAFIDVIFCAVAPFVDWYWFQTYESEGSLSPSDITNYCLFIGYLTLRTWAMTVKPRNRAWSLASNRCGLQSMECLELVWVCRSASLVAEIAPDIEESWKQLVKTWGKEQASSVCRISIHVTDTDEHARNSLKRELRCTNLYQDGCIRFGRPSLPQLIRDHTVNLVETRRSSNTLLAYVGSEQLARQVHHMKISNDIITAITGNKRHQMEFFAESYGGSRKKVSSGPLVFDEASSFQGSESMEHETSQLTTRLNRTFDLSHEPEFQLFNSNNAFR